MTQQELEVHSEDVDVEALNNPTGRFATTTAQSHRPFNWHSVCGDGFDFFYFWLGNGFVSHW